jgi:hypothetical protein
MKFTDGLTQTKGKKPISRWHITICNLLLGIPLFGLKTKTNHFRNIVICPGYETMDKVHKATNTSRKIRDVQTNLL